MFLNQTCMGVGSGATRGDLKNDWPF
jgi:hypothetical protein